MEHKDFKNDWRLTNHETYLSNVELKNRNIKNSQRTGDMRISYEKFIEDCQGENFCTFVG